MEFQYVSAVVEACYADAMRASLESPTREIASFATSRYLTMRSSSGPPLLIVVPCSDGVPLGDVKLSIARYVAEVEPAAYVCDVTEVVYDAITAPAPAPVAARHEKQTVDSDNENDDDDDVSPVSFLSARDAQMALVRSRQEEMGLGTRDENKSRSPSPVTATEVIRPTHMSAQKAHPTDLLTLPMTPRLSDAYYLPAGVPGAFPSMLRIRSGLNVLFVLESDHVTFLNVLRIASSTSHTSDIFISIVLLRTTDINGHRPLIDTFLSSIVPLMGPVVRSSIYHFLLHFLGMWVVTSPCVLYLSSAVLVTVSQILTAEGFTAFVECFQALLTQHIGIFFPVMQWSSGLPIDVDVYSNEDGTALRFPHSLTFESHAVAETMHCAFVLLHQAKCPMSVLGEVCVHLSQAEQQQAEFSLAAVESKIPPGVFGIVSTALHAVHAARAHLPPKNVVAIETLKMCRAANRATDRDKSLAWDIAHMSDFFGMELPDNIMTCVVAHLRKITTGMGQCTSGAMETVLGGLMCDVSQARQSVAYLKHLRLVTVKDGEMDWSVLADEEQFMVSGSARKRANK